MKTSRIILILTVVAIFIMMFIAFFNVRSEIINAVSIYGKGDLITEKGNIESKMFNVETFNGIANNIDANVHITKSDKQSVKIVSKPNITKNILLEVVDGILIIKFDEEIRHKTPIDIDISIPKLTSIAIIGSGDINTTNVFDSCDVFSVNVIGSGDVEAKLSSKSTTYVNIIGSGDVVLIGNCPNQEIVIDGSGDVNNFDFNTDYSSATINGSGTIKLTANKTVKAVINGSGDLYYKGSPIVEKIINGSGEIEKNN
jgi:hypothetical protein